MAKIINLTQNQIAIIDDEDYESLNQYKWHAQKASNGFYAVRCVYVNRKCIKLGMHRQVLPCLDNQEIDHKNRNTLDNRKSNLRIVTHAQNMKNRNKHKNNKSGIKGVYWDKRGKKWRSEIRVDGKKIHLGMFSDLMEAKTMRNNSEIKYFGEYSAISNN